MRELRLATPRPLVANAMPGVYETPQAHDEPRVRERIARLALVESKRIAPVLAPYVERPRRRPRRRVEAAPPNAAVATSSMWAGCVNAGHWRSVTGTWRVPAAGKGINDAAGADGGWWVSTWVGLDGDGNGEVLQAGVDGRVEADGSSRIFPWYEWYIDNAPAGSPAYVDPITITNLSVAAADRVCIAIEYVLDGAGHATGGSITFANLTNGQHFSIMLAPPPTAAMPGAMAEWIVEDPGGGYPGTALALFTPTTFTEATCASWDGATQGLVGDSQTLYDIVNPAGVTLTVIGSPAGSTQMDAAYYEYNID